MAHATDFISTFMKNSNHKFRFLGNAGMVDLGNGNIAKVTLGCQRILDHYTCLNVKIVNKQDGNVEAMDFCFNKMDIDIDKQNPNAEYNARNGLYVWKQFEWYVNKPTAKSAKKLAQEIDDYISFFA